MPGPELPIVRPVEIGPIRYEAVHDGKSRDLGQNGGHVAAIEIATGRELWVEKIYHISYGRGMSPSKFDVFITRMELAEDGRHLLITNQKGERFLFDPASRSIDRQGGGDERGFLDWLLGR